MLYRITTEFIKNTLTYAQATDIEIQFDYDKTGNTISFSYIDNGIGFDWEKIQQDKKGLGLMNIQQRVQVLKGNLKIESKPGHGIKALIKFPVEKNTNQSIDYMPLK
jgi:signal transduction histidine kinase